MFCDDLEGWDVGGRGGREAQEAGELCIHKVTQQKPTQHCKAIILQFLKVKIN